MAGVPARRAIGLGLCSAIVWNACVLLCGHLLGANWEQVTAGLAWVGKLGVYAVIAGVLLVGITLLLRASRRARP